MDFLATVYDGVLAVFSSLPSAFRFLGRITEYIPSVFLPLITFTLACRLFSVLYHKDPGGDA